MSGEPSFHKPVFRPTFIYVFIVCALRRVGVVESKGKAEHAVSTGAFSVPAAVVGLYNVDQVPLY